MVEPAGKRRVLIISHDVVGTRMAGPGIRYWEIARTLSRYYDVTLAAPQPIDVADPPFTARNYVWGQPESLAGVLQDADVVVVNGYVLSVHPELAHIQQPLAIDLYDPTVLENLELFRHAEPERRAAQHEHDVGLLRRQLTAGDFYLCATERQRDLYLGALMAAGRVTPAYLDVDPELRSLIDIVPFGTPAEPPVHTQPSIRDVIPGVGRDDMVLLWTGGLWDWLDPLTLIRAMPDVVAQEPRVRLVFLAGKHPGDAAQMRMPDEAKALAHRLDLLHHHVFFYDRWVPYGQRASFLLEADVAVTLHRRHLETAYAAVRSRFLDHLWAGLPSIVTEGDAAAELVRDHQLGRIVQPQDVQDVVAALLDLLKDTDARIACGKRARRLAATFSWERCVVPLAQWIGAVQKGDRPAEDVTFPATARMGLTLPETPSLQPVPRNIVEDDTRRNSALANVEKHLQIDEPPTGQGLLGPLRRLVVQQFVRPFVVPMLQQQTTFNAAAVKALYALSEDADRRRSSFYELQNQLEAPTTGAGDRLKHLEQRMLDLEDANTTLAETLLVERRADEESPSVQIDESA